MRKTLNVWSKILSINSLLIIIIVFLIGCGGGGGSSLPTKPSPQSSDWNTMIWDQGNWE